VNCFAKYKAASRVARILRAGILLLLAGGAAAGAAQGQPGGPPGAAAANPVAVENARPGNPDWGLDRPSLRHEIEGYASAAGVEAGDTLGLRVSTGESRFDLEVFRLGWYAGAGARRVYERRGLRGARRAVPRPREGDGLIACDWPVSARVPVRRDWVTGIYLARLTARPGGASLTEGMP